MTTLKGAKMPFDDMVDHDDQYGEEEPEKLEPESGDPQDGDPTEPTGDELEPESGDPENPYDVQFRELGLDKQFQGGVPDALSRLPHMNKYQTHLAQENAELKRKLEETNRPEPRGNNEYDPEQFYQNPYPHLDGRYATVEQVRSLQGQLQADQDARARDGLNRFMQEHPDFNQVLPVMQQVLAMEPGYGQLRDPLPVLYREAKRVMGEQTKANINKTKDGISQDINKQKGRAVTEGGGTKPKQRKITPDDLYNMPLDELADYLGVDDKDE